MVAYTLACKTWKFGTSRLPVRHNRVESGKCPDAEVAAEGATHPRDYGTVAHTPLRRKDCNIGKAGAQRKIILCDKGPHTGRKDRINKSNDLTLRPTTSRELVSGSRPSQRRPLLGSTARAMLSKNTKADFMPVDEVASLDIASA